MLTVKKNQCRTKALIEKYLPDFCWMTSIEVLAFLEGIDENAEYGAVNIALHQMSQGACPRVEARMSPIKHCAERRTILTGYQMMYRFNPRFERVVAPRNWCTSHAKLLSMVEESVARGNRAQQPKIPYSQYAPRPHYIYGTKAPAPYQSGDRGRQPATV